nr:hypothetical protein [Burkholderia pseudomallei]
MTMSVSIRKRDTSFENLALRGYVATASTHRVEMHGLSQASRVAPIASRMGQYRISISLASTADAPQHGPQSHRQRA